MDYVAPWVIQNGLRLFAEHAMRGGRILISRRGERSGADRPPSEGLPPHRHGRGIHSNQTTLQTKWMSDVKTVRFNLGPCVNFTQKA